MKRKLNEVIILIFIILCLLTIIQAILKTDKSAIYTQESKANKAQLGAYSKGYKAGYNAALREIKEREYLDRGVR